MSKQPGKETDPLVPKDGSPNPSPSGRGRSPRSPRIPAGAGGDWNILRRASSAVQQHTDRGFKTVTKNQLLNRICNDYVIHENQFDRYGSTMLMFARVMKCILIFFVGMSTACLVIGFLTGTIETVEQVEQYNHLPAPGVVLCPAEGWKFKSIEIKKVEYGQVPTGEIGFQEIQFKKERPVSAHLAERCEMIKLNQEMYPRGEAGHYESFDRIRISYMIKYKPRDGHEDERTPKTYYLGFFSEEGMVPQQWSLFPVGKLVTGNIEFNQIAKGKTEFTEGTTTDVFDFRSTGVADNYYDLTSVEYGYDKYVCFVLSSFKSMWSFFAIITFILLFSTGLNNFGLFEICFPETSEEGNPPELEPNIMCQMCGLCCQCCRPLEDMTPEGSGRSTPQDIKQEV